MKNKVRDLKILFGIFMSSLTFILFIFKVIFMDLTFFSYFILFFSVLMLISTSIYFGQLLQVILLFISMIVTIFYSSDLGFSMVQFITLFILLEKYGMFKNNLILKISLLSVVFYISVIINGVVDNYSLYKGFSYSIVCIIMFLAVLLFKIDDINRTIKDNNIKNRVEKSNNKELKVSYEYYEMMDLTYIDPLEAGLSEAEYILLKNLCLYKESNADLAIRLSKSVNTIKVQMKSLLVKIGAESRHQLVDLCLNYFIEKEYLTHQN